MTRNLSNDFSYQPAPRDTGRDPFVYVIVGLIGFVSGYSVGLIINAIVRWFL